MAIEWDYTKLADAYLKRPDYSPAALEALFRIACLKQGDKVCDIGAGVAHLTLPLAAYGCQVDAVEPNDAMRANGMQRTASLATVHWSKGTGEATGRPSGNYDLVTFGSSFNVCDRAAALRESHRLLKPGGYFACLWNHRNLEDHVQKNIEAIIKDSIPTYDYGTRREDQTEVISRSGLFENLVKVEGSSLQTQTVDDAIEAWRSHATLERQAGSAFPFIVDKLSAYLRSLGSDAIQVPYITRAWIARRK